MSSELIHRLWICAGSGIRRIHERVRARFGAPQQPPLRVVFAVPPAHARRRPVPAHVAARLLPIDGGATALVRPYLHTQEASAGV